MARFQIEFSGIKRKIFIRDDWKCLLNDFGVQSKIPSDLKNLLGLPIGETGRCFGSLTIDHIQRRSTGGGNELENLITLCLGHHAWVEDMTQAKKSELLHKILSDKYGYEYE